MKITKYSLAIFPVLIAVMSLAGARTTFAEGDKPNLPGSAVTLEEALLLKNDFIAVAKLVKLGDGDPPRFTPGTIVYENVEFEIISVLKGKASGTVKCMLFVDLNQPQGSRGVQENVKYIIFCKTAKNGVLVAGKLLPDDEETERKISGSQ
jgi:hypothetical protein